MHFILYLFLLGLKRDKRGEFAWIEFFPSLPSVDHYNYLYIYAFISIGTEYFVISEKLQLHDVIIS